MAQYIDKADLVAEIKKHQAIWDGIDSDYCKGENDAYSDMLSFLDTLEVKEVDLEKALSDLDKDIKEFVMTEEFENESTTVGRYWVIAKHAFLLGLKAIKGE